jgi:hypothetical protein
LPIQVSRCDFGKPVKKSVFLLSIEDIHHSSNESNQYWTRDSKFWQIPRVFAPAYGLPKKRFERIPPTKGVIQ